MSNLCKIIKFIYVKIWKKQPISPKNEELYLLKGLKKKVYYWKGYIIVVCIMPQVKIDNGFEEKK